jgi:exosome complex component RRP42
MSTFLHQTLSHHSLRPNNLSIIPHKKSWLLNLDIVVLSDAGNVYDAMFMAARAALWDTKVPRTRSVEYKAKKGDAARKGGGGDMDVDVEPTSGFDTMNYTSKAVDFELPDYWDEGEVLDGRDRWPVCVTLNLVRGFRYLFFKDIGRTVAHAIYRSCRQYIIWTQPFGKRHRHRFDCC